MHTIRLREPWECLYSEGAYRWIRRFNRPTGLSSESVVELHIERLQANALVIVNGRGVACVGVENVTHIFPLDAEMPSHMELVIAVPTAESSELPPKPFEVARLLLD